METYWKQVQELLNDLLALPLHQRSRFLEDITDSSIRDEVRSLLVSYEELSDAPLEETIQSAAGDWARASQRGASSERQPRFEADEIVDNRYRIVSLLGSGGMGEVYRAQDLKLIQPVALKCLPLAWASDPQRRARLHSEVRLARQVSHPNVCRVYDIGEANGILYISMEYVDGEDLSSLLRRVGRLPAEKASEFSQKLAAGLTAAHQKGVIHRDLKPANIMIDGRGEVLITDFSLSESMGDLDGHSVQNGTPAYMAPEQLRGLEVSSKSDIYAFGLVIFEMFAGRRAYEDGNRCQPSSDVLRLVKDLQPEAERVIRLCLADNPESRPESALAAVSTLNLKDSAVDSSSVKLLPELLYRKAKNVSIRVVVSVVALFLAVFAAGVVLMNNTGLLKRVSPPTSSVANSAEESIPLETPVTRYEGYETQPSLSPDGSRVAFVWNRTPGNYDLFVKGLSAENPLRLTNSPAHDLHPSWSPDGHSIAFLRLYPDNRKEVFTISALGGPEHLLFRNNASWPLWTQEVSALGMHYPGPAWSPDGKFLAIADRLHDADPNSITLVSLTSGYRRQVTWPTHGQEGDFAPCFSPDGKMLAFIRTFNFGGDSDIYVQPLDGRTAAKRVTFRNGTFLGLSWLSADEIVFPANFSNGRRFWRLNIRDGKLKPLGNAQGNIYDPSVSRDGRTLVYSLQFRNTNVWRAPVKRNRKSSANPIKLVASSTKNDSAAYSPDGARIAFVSNRSGRPGIYICRADGSDTVSLTTTKGRSIGTPRWSPDGQTIVFDTDLNGHSVIETIAAIGSVPSVFAAHPGDDHVMPSWSRNGKYIYYSIAHGNADFQIWKKPFSGGPAVQLTHHGGGDRVESVDGRRVFYDKRPGIWQIPSAGGEERPVPGLNDTPTNRLFWVGASGIYFLSAKDFPWIVHLLDLSNNRMSRVGQVKETPEFWTPSFSLSPDEKWMIYSQTDQSGSDLNIVKGF